jgi:predicted dithiol-disulfide oxidoreductase (DUF899 family)
MSLPDVVSREEWLVARKELLAREKELTRLKDSLNTARRELPMVRIEKDYRFDGPRGEVGLLDLFEGRRQLAVQHFMFDPRWEDGCPGCSADVEERSEGLLAHLRTRETSLAIVSRAPLAKLEAYKAKRGWTVDWYSSFGSDFNYDFHVTLDASVAPILHNYREPEELLAAGFESLTLSENQPSEQPGWSFFLRDGDEIFHTYSMFGRGTEAPHGPRPAGGVGGAQGARRAARAVSPVLRGHRRARVMLVANGFRPRNKRPESVRVTTPKREPESTPGLPVTSHHGRAAGATRANAGGTSSALRAASSSPGAAHHERSWHRSGSPPPARRRTA